MNYNRLWSWAVAALSLGVATTVMDGEQNRPQRRADESVSVKVSLKVGEQFMTSSGPGTCTHAPRAAIYNVPSEMWSVRQQADSRSTQLTLWKPTDGKEEMFNLSLNGAKDVNVSTVRGGTVSGSGTATFKAAGKGGIFTINAKSKSGEGVTGTIECSAFTAAIAEGG